MTTATTSAPPADESRRMLQESLRRLLERRWPASDAPAAAQDAGALRRIWQALAEQGVGLLGHDPDMGGMQETVLALAELGRSSCTAPLIAAAVLNHAGLPGDDPVLEAMRDGRAWVALSFGERDGDPRAVAPRVGADRITGSPAFVEHADAATHLAVLTDGPALAIVDLRACTPAQCTIEATAALGMPGLHRVVLADAPARVVPLDPARAEAMRLRARLGHAARACGAAGRAFELATAYACERKQFGRPIGAFQAIQHKLADIHMALLATRLTIGQAAREIDADGAHWAQFVDCACVLAGEQLRQASLQTQHAFGAIGYSEEHEAPRHFRRVHLDVLRLGGPGAARESLAAWWLDAPDRTLPPSDLGPAGNAFRDEVRAWLDTHWSGARKAAHDAKPFAEREYDDAFARDLGRTGWIGLGWPERFGGQGRGPWEQIAFMEAMERADAPRVGAPVQSAMLQVYGTPAQQQRLLPEILRGEAIWGMGYSEPDAGSDLAALRTSAVRVPPEDGGGWRIDGQKIWTTTYWGRYMLLATRTDPDAKPKHAGITMFIVPMDTPGITIRTSRTMYGGTFANVFYDDVRLPDDAVIGEIGGGWETLTGALATERGYIGGGIVLKVARSFELLCAHLRATEVDGRPMSQDPRVRERIASLAAQIEAGRQLMLHCAARVTGGVTPPEDGAVSKVWSGELMERFGETALELLGLTATLSEDSPGAILAGRLEQQLRHSLMWVISIGTNEIQRSLIAQRGLGLPR